MVANSSSRNLQSVTTKGTLQKGAGAQTMASKARTSLGATEDNPNFQPDPLVLHTLEVLSGISVHGPSDPIFEQAAHLYQGLKLGITTPSRSSGKYKVQLDSLIAEEQSKPVTVKDGNASDTTQTPTSIESGVKEDEAKKAAAAVVETASVDTAATEQTSKAAHATPEASNLATEAVTSKEGATDTTATNVADTTSYDAATGKLAIPLAQSTMIALPQNAGPALVTKNEKEVRQRNNPPHRAVRYNSMSVLSMEQIMVNCMLANAINLLLQVELDCFLGFARYTHVSKDKCQPAMRTPDIRTTSNYSQKNLRNGFYVRNINTQFGYVSIQYPRDRFCTFSSHIIQKNISQLNISETLLLSLYTCVNQTQFETVIGQICDPHTTLDYIRTLAYGANIRFNKWRKQKLSDECSFLCINNLCFNLEPEINALRLPSNLEPIQIWQVAMGILPNGKHKILSLNPLTANPSFASSMSYSETLSHGHQTGRHVLPQALTASLWRNLLNDLCNRGLSKVDYVCMDGAIEALLHVLEFFPKTHVIRKLIPVEGECRYVIPPTSLLARTSSSIKHRLRQNVFGNKQFKNIDQLEDLINTFRD